MRINCCDTAIQWTKFNAEAFTSSLSQEVNLWRQKTGQSVKNFYTSDFFVHRTADATLLRSCIGLPTWIPAKIGDR